MRFCFKVWIYPLRSLNSRLITGEITHCAFDKENTRMFFGLMDRLYNREGWFRASFTSNYTPFFC